MSKAVVEPIFGQIKERRNFRRFSLRGHDNVCAEWCNRRIPIRTGFYSVGRPSAQDPRP
jgi:hypothetical protein